MSDKAALLLSHWSALGVATGLLLWRGSYQKKKTWAPRLVVLTGPTCHGDI